MKIILSKTTMVIKKEKTAKFEVIDNLTIKGDSTTTQKIASGLDTQCIVVLETEKNINYKITLTPQSDSPTYKWGNTNSKEIGTLISNYDSGGGVSRPTTMTITGNDFKYFVLSKFKNVSISIEVV